MLYFRVVSATMFLLRGVSKLRCTRDGLEGEALQNKTNDVNEMTLSHRRDFYADTNACCTLAQQLLCASALSPNLHAWFCIIPYLLDTCGHPKFEVCIERLVSIHISYSAFVIPSIACHVLFFLYSLSFPYAKSLLTQQ